MFRFANPEYLYVLTAIPLLIVVFYVTNAIKRKKLKSFGDPALLQELMPDVSRRRMGLKFWLQTGALTMCIIALCGPQFGSKLEKSTRQGAELMIALDVSNSMLAEDIQPNRLTKAKQILSKLVDKLQDDKIGLIVFAGEAYTQLPITSDYVSAKVFMDNISPSMIATQGTDIAGAIRLAMNSFTQQEGVGKAIIIITDGEDHEGGAIDAAKEAVKKGLRVYVLGVGSPNGSPIPVPGSSQYMKDNTGNTVISKLNEQMCREVASAGNGAYIHVDNSNLAQMQLNGELDKLAKKDISSSIYSEYDEQLQAVGIIAMLLLIIEICVLERRNPLLKKLKLFRK